MKKTLKISGLVIGALVLMAIFLETLPGAYPDKSGYDKGSVDYGVPGLAVPAMPMGGSLESRQEETERRSSGLIKDQGSANTKSDIASPAPDAPSVDKKIIKNGNLAMRVDSVDRAAEKISEIAKNNQGEVSSSNFSQYKTSNKSGYITVKVPVNNFESAFSELKKVAIIVTNESTSGQDVTEEYADLQGQLKNKQSEEEAFARIMEQAQKIEDILSVQAELSRVRGEIERIQGRIKFMDSQTDMSTIAISLSEDTNVTIVDSWRPWQVVKDSVRELIKSVQESVDFLIKLIIQILPILILYGLVILVLYKLGRRIYTKYIQKDTQN